MARKAGNNLANTIFGSDKDDEVFGLQGFDTLFGRIGDDRIFGGEGQDRMFGGLGEDTMLGGEFHDVIRGGRDDDVIFGGRGDDTISVGAGQSGELNGGGGGDTFVFARLSSADATRGQLNYWVQDFEVGIDEIELNGTVVDVISNGDSDCAPADFAAVAVLDNGARLEFIGLTIDELTDAIG